MVKEKKIKIDDYSLFTLHITAENGNKHTPTIVFLHDSWGCTTTWKDFPQLIAQKYNCNALVYDRRGYGKSDAFAITKRDKTYLHQSAEELIKVLDFFKLKQVLLYGHSDGASISTIVAQEYPKRVSAILLEGNHLFVEPKTQEGIRTCVEKSKTNSLLSTLKKYHAGNADELFRLWHETWLSDEFSDWSIVEDLGKIKCPILAFQGENDELGSVRQLEIMEDNVHSFIMTKEIKDAGHTPRKENPTETLELIDLFFDKTKILKI